MGMIGLGLRNANKLKVSYSMSSISELTRVELHAWLGVGDCHFHKAVRHVRGKDGTAAARD